MADNKNENARNKITISYRERRLNTNYTADQDLLVSILLFLHIDMVQSAAASVRSYKIAIVQDDTKSASV